MGTGTDAARSLNGGDNAHADLIDDFKDQLIIVLVKRLQRNGRLRIPVREVDDTGMDTLAFSVVDGVFTFVLGKKS